MEKVQLNIKGITTTAKSEPGDSYNLVNLRRKNGALLPVIPRKTVKEIDAYYDIVFLHTLPDGTAIMIGIDGTSVYSHIDILRQLVSSLPGPAQSIQQIGNTISIMCDDSLFYMLYKGDSYIPLGSLPELPTISISTTTTETEITGSYSAQYGSGTTNTDNLQERSIGLISKLIDDNKENVMLYDSCYVRYAFRLFDGRYIKHSSPILVNPQWHYKDAKRAYIGVVNAAANPQVILDTSTVHIKRYKLQLELDSTHLDSWSDIITSVDVFLSPALGLAAIENGGNVAIALTTSNQYTSLLPFAGATTKANIVAESKFFEALSLPHAANTVTFPSTPEHYHKLNTLEFNRSLPDDISISHHRIGAKKSYVYNNRLHIADVKIKTFPGFTMSSFKMPGGYNGVTEDWSDITMFATKVSFSDPQINPAWNYNSEDNIADRYHLLSPFVSYPDNRANRIEIFRHDLNGWERIHDLPLQPHPVLNVSYYLNSDFSPLPATSGGEPVSIQPENEQVDNYTYQKNVLRVSEVNNPFVISRVYSFDSDVLSVASNTIKSSDYGQFPLYVLTSRRIYAMQVGQGDIAYSNIVTTSNDQPVSGKVLSTPYGVVYITKRGLKLIGEPGLITEKNEEPRRPCNFDQIYRLSDPFFSTPHPDLTAVLADPNLMMAYNFKDDEIILRGAGQTYAIRQGEMYRSTEAFDGIVLNAYPDLLTFSRTLPQGTIAQGDDFMGEEVALILQPGEGEYEEGKIKGYTALYFDPRMTCLYGELDFDDGNWNPPTRAQMELVVASGYQGLLGAEQSVVWLVDEDGGETAPVLYNSYNASTGYVYGVEPKASYQSQFYIKVEDFTAYIQGKITIKSWSQGEGRARIALTTRPYDFGTHLHKRLERCVFRCQLLNANNTINVMLHGSNDSVNMKALKGMLYAKKWGTSDPTLNFKDIDLGMTAYKYKYYSFSLAALVEEGSVIDVIEIEIEQEYNNDKIR